MALSDLCRLTCTSTLASRTGSCLYYVCGSSPPLVQGLFQVGGGVGVARGVIQHSQESRGSLTPFRMANALVRGKADGLLVSSIHCFKFSEDTAAPPSYIYEGLLSLRLSPAYRGPLTDLCVVICELQDGLPQPPWMKGQLGKQVFTISSLFHGKWQGKRW